VCPEQLPDWLVCRKFLLLLQLSNSFFFFEITHSNISVLRSRELATEHRRLAEIIVYDDVVNRNHSCCCLFYFTSIESLRNAFHLLGIWMCLSFFVGDNRPQEYFISLFLLMLLVGSHDAGSFMSVSFTPVYIHHSIMGDR
jgi:hypothetical protein